MSERELAKEIALEIHPLLAAIANWNDTLAPNGGSNTILLRDEAARELYRRMAVGNRFMSPTLYVHIERELNWLLVPSKVAVTVNQYTEYITLTRIQNNRVVEFITLAELRAKNLL